MARPITLDSVLQNNLLERQKATGELLAPTTNAAPAVASNPISLLSSGLNQMQQGVGGQFTRAENQNAQDTLNRLAQLDAAEQAEQTQYNRGLDTFNQESSLAAQALAKAKFAQQNKTQSLSDASQKARIDSIKQGTALTRRKFDQEQREKKENLVKANFNADLDNRLYDLVNPLRNARASNQKLAQQAEQLGLIYDTNTKQFADPTGNTAPALIGSINSSLVQNDLTGAGVKANLANQLDALEKAGRSTFTTTDDLSLADRNRLSEQLVSEISSTYQLDANEEKVLAGKMGGIEAKRSSALKSAGLDQTTQLMNELQTFKSMVEEGKTVPNPIVEFVKGLPEEVSNRGYVQEQVKDAINTFKDTKNGRDLPENYLNVLLHKVLPTASVGQTPWYWNDVNNNELDKGKLLKRMQDESVRIQAALDKFNQRDKINRKYDTEAQTEQLRVFAKSGIIRK